MSELLEIENLSVRPDFYRGLMQLTINARNPIRPLISPSAPIDANDPSTRSVCDSKFQL